MRDDGGSHGEYDSPMTVEPFASARSGAGPTRERVAGSVASQCPDRLHSAVRIALIQIARESVSWWSLPLGFWRIAESAQR